MNALLPAALSYAFTLGLVAAVNPCGFPLLPAYLALFSDGPHGRSGEKMARGLLSGAGVTFGFVAVFGGLGALLEAGMGLASGWLPWPMAAAGAAMVALGILTLCGRPVYLSLPVPRVAAGSRTFAATVVFGMAYAVGSLSCSLPLFLAAVGSSFTRLGFLAGMACYLAYALGMGLFVTAAALATAALGSGALRLFRRVGAILPVLSGSVLVLSGAYLAYYWLAELADPGGSIADGPALRAVGGAQSAITAFLSSHLILAGSVLMLAVLAGFAVVVWKNWTGTGEADRAPSVKGSSHD